MLTIDDLKLLLQIISSNRVSFQGHEVRAVFNLQRKLALAIDAANGRKEPQEDGQRTTQDPPS